MILAADVGGTKTELAVFTMTAERLVPVVSLRVKSRDYDSLETIARELAAQVKGDIAAACVGVAGPVVGGRCRTTNLPWVVDSARLRRALKIPVVALLNDLEALAYGIATLPPRAFKVLNRGATKPQGAIAVIAAGTGLGEAGLIWDGTRYRALASEGGHADLAPRTGLEADLWRWLRRCYGHVSYERVLSGPGKLAIYEFLKSAKGPPEPAWLTARMAAGDPSAVLSEVALEGADARCVQALELFCAMYGAEAGNLALKLFATGGVFVGGGIAPTILPMLANGAFMRAFTDKGRFAGLMSAIPVRVILEPRTGLLGAARYARTWLLTPPRARASTRARPARAGRRG